MLLFLCWKSTKAQEKQVMFNVLCIFCIFCIIGMFCIFYILEFGNISYALIYLYTAWVDTCQSTTVYRDKCNETAQVLYVIPVSSILGLIPLVQVGKTGTILFDKQQESANFLSAVCDRTKKSSNG